MPYSQFTVPEVERTFGLTVRSAALFQAVPPAAPSATVTAFLNASTSLALAQATEKARSELLVAPVLAELWHQAGRMIAVYSGTELNVDPARALVGVCDFVVSGPPQLYPIRSPILAVVESKRDDLSSGYGQCAAALVAALELNRREASGREVVYGAVSTGLEWQFLRLSAAELVFDTQVLLITDLANILGILLAICGFGPAPLHPRPDAK